jgi:hypothetical protein
VVLAEDVEREMIEEIVITMPSAALKSASVPVGFRTIYYSFHAPIAIHASISITTESQEP